MKDVVKRYGVAVLVVSSLLGLYRAYQSYRHFEWQNIPTPSGVYAVPSWRK